MGYVVLYMSEVLACSKCRKLFNSIFGKRICPECEKKMEDDLVRVRDYLWEHKGASITQVAEACEVSPRQIRQWLREERIQLADDSVIEIQCESCGKTISTGRYCPACKHAMHKEMQEAAKVEKPKITFVDKKEPSASAKMRFINK